MCLSQSANVDVTYLHVLCPHSAADILFLLCMHMLGTKLLQDISRSNTNCQVLKHFVLPSTLHNIDTEVVINIAFQYLNSFLMKLIRYMTIIPSHTP